MSTFKTAVAQSISYPLHPGIMPTAGSLLVLYSVPYLYAWEDVVRITTTVFIGTYIAPILVILTLRAVGVIESIHLIKKQDRIYPYLASVVCILATGNFLQNWGVPIELTLSVYITAFVIIVSTILLPFWKSSAHMSGITAMFALFMVLHNKYGIGNIVTLITFSAAIAAVAWARTVLKRHTMLELLSGGLLGFIAVYFLLPK